MTTYNTGNSLGSSAAKDLYDNAQNFDHLSNDLENEMWPDRFGKSRLTWHGMEKRYQDKLSSMGWTLIDSFQGGAILTRADQALRWMLPDGDGEYYRWDGGLPKNVPAGSTPSTTGGIGTGAWIGIGDASLRSDLHKPDGATIVGLGSEHTVADLIDPGIDNGDALMPVIQPFPHAGQRSQHLKNAENLSVGDWLAVDGVDSSVQAQEMIDDTGMLIVPEGFTLVAKNLNLATAKKVIVHGKLKLPSGCADFDRLLYAAGNNSGLIIHINEIDGNKAGQSGQIGTHLVYLTDCHNVDFYAHYVHDHYYPRTFTTAPSPDGIRNDGTGCLFFYQCHKSKFIVDRIESWGHEAFYIYKTNRSIAALGHAQGASGDDAYSGIQFSGDYNRLLYASVDLASASGIGFDCRWSMAGKLISTNTQFFHGINFGHAGLPTTGSTIESVYVNTCGQNGVNFAAGSANTRVLSAYINAAGQSGVNQSDGAAGNTVNNVTIVNPVVAQATSFQNNLILTNANLATVTSALIPKLNATGGGTFTTRNVRLSSADSMEMKVFNGLGGVASATLTDGNINPYAHIVIYPANSSAAAANAYIASQTTGSLVLATQSGAAAAGGASFRYMVI